MPQNAAQYLSKGSRVNVVGRVQNNTYQNAQGQTVYALSFTCEEIDYLDSKAEAEARRQQQKQAKPAEVTTKRTRSSKAPKGPGEYDVPF